MPAPLLSVSRRTRSTPFSNRVESAGVAAYTVYNHMLLPTVFESLEADCAHLKEHVQVWDVSVERQVAITGPDAAKLIQVMTPRDLSKAALGQCFYIPVVDDRGGMLNDPVAIKHADDRYWISVADSDMLLWAKGLAYGFRFEVDVDEPDVHPLAVQGPKAEELVARLFGDEVRDIRFFRGKWLNYEGQSLFVARSGYSKQGGFEIYVNPAELGEPIWDALFAAGEDLNVRPGGPNLIERIEGGLLSYGNDMTRENTPFECGLGRFCDVETSIGSVGREALMRQSKDGPMRFIKGIMIEGEPLEPCRNPWPMVSDGGEFAGQVTSCAFSPDLRSNVAIGMVERDYWRVGNTLWVDTSQGQRRAEVTNLPFPKP